MTEQDLLAEKRVRIQEATSHYQGHMMWRWSAPKDLGGYEKCTGCGESRKTIEKLKSHSPWCHAARLLQILGVSDVSIPWDYGGRG